MFKALLTRLGPSAPVAIPDDLWQATLDSLPFVARLDVAERSRLRALAARLLGTKEMAGAGELELTAPMQVSIAVQACLPVLNLGLDWYRGWRSIIVYPSQFLVPRAITDDSGVVHEYTEPISGEAWDGGPLIVSWDDARGGGNGEHAFNVVIHEFTHKIDMLDGEPDGMPPFDARTHPDLDPRAWRRSLEEAYRRFSAEVELIDAELPPDIDADAAAADAWFAGLPLDPYAAQDEGEFFAVSSESFFVDPARLFEAFPDWYRQLALFFKQDPLAP